MSGIMPDHDSEGYFDEILHEESLEAVIEAENTESSLPVITLASPQRILIDKSYARRTAEVILDRLMNIENFRGVGRLFVP